MKAKLLATSALALLAAMLPVAGAWATTADLRPRTWTVADRAIVGEDGDDEFGEDGIFDEDGTLTDNPDRADQGTVGEQGEYREGEYGERDSTGWNPPPVDHADESGELLEGLGQGGSVSTPPPNSGAPLVDSTGQGSSGILD